MCIAWPHGGRQNLGALPHRQQGNMIQRVQQIGSSNAASITLPFPSVEQIRRVADDPASEESVLQRLRASFCYLPRHEHAVLGEAARVASRCERAWVFSEPEVVQTKQLLGVARPQPSQSPDLSVRLADFHREYTTQLAESCVLQRRIAETLWYRNARTGQVTYVESVEDALRRSDRDSLLRAAIHLFLETFLHEQRRFAFGSSLKDLVHRALRQYPAELHQLLLTSTRGDFWSRYDRDLLAYAQS
ncbi:MAG: hypothetical protein MUF54_06635, partial [Polyangiaceae bacterium]|nr:hypothetical protein [Polyangiaceae bacterium]